MDSNGQFSGIFKIWLKDKFIPEICNQRTRGFTAFKFYHVLSLFTYKLLLNIRESADFSNFQKVNWKGSLSHSQRKDHQTSSDTLEPTICMDLPISHSSQTNVTTSAYISLILLLHSTSCYYILLCLFIFLGT